LSKKVSSAKEGLIAGTGIEATEFERVASAISVGSDPAEILSDKFTDAFSLTGTPDECLAQAAKYASAGITELALTFDGPGAVDHIRLLGAALGRAG
jgi:alkanesulfonate monooxygenase SsuD/methylene tetrahydromethanopterin reductase-like flavin-dependent oxidoreductase (luciferase family)